MPLFIQQKRELTKNYEQWLTGIEGVQLFKEPANTRSNYWLQTILLDEQFNRDEVLDFLNEQGVMSRPIWNPMHHLAIYQNCPKSDLSVTDQLNRSVVNIPSTPISEG